MAGSTSKAAVRSAWLSYSLQLKRSFGITSDSVWVRAPSDEELAQASPAELERLAKYLQRQIAALRSA